MPDLYALNSDASLRGPLLAAHRALRKAVDARAAQSKGECSAISWNLRQRGTDPVSHVAVLRPLHIAQGLQAAMKAFGGPKLIPESTGFVKYLLNQQNKVLNDCLDTGLDVYGDTSRFLFDADTPVGADKQAALNAHKAQSTMIARREFAQLFEGTFGELVGRVLNADVTAPGTK